MKVKCVEDPEFYRQIHYPLEYQYAMDVAYETEFVYEFGVLTGLWL